ncbi:MAG: serine--tRNA ligase [Bacteroidetes bacterium]|nr:serine--tRNA ligase [Bacteroidota bacterium]MBK7039043.1 serine--tRNA ligase [Bacteroidota bacterium]MBK9482369.1 serine--tRNA ligase [Bacteroidota bacterium]
MLQLQLLRTQKEFVQQRLGVKNYKDIEAVDTILKIDEERRKIQTENEELLAKINLASKEIGKMMASGEKEQAETMKAEVANYKESSKALSEKLSLLEQQQYDELVKLPNLPNELVPLGKTPEENLVVKTGNEIPELYEGAVPHWDLCSKYNLINFELGTKITGAGFPVYINKGARLQRALINYFLDYNTQAGYTEYQPPHMVNTDSAYGTGQLPDKEGQMYHATVDDFYLIPTAEVPVTNIYRDEIIKESDLPIMMTAYTPCFRREAGSYGKDVRGLNRLHQFDKVEIVRFSVPEKSYEALDEMVAHVEKLIQSLELPYRILRLCGGDMSFASALTYDFEVYSAAQKRWLEVSSVSNFETFQTNRMKIRYKNADGKMQLVHSLNGSSLALPRIVACLLENHQTAEGIKVPAALVPYLGMGMID